MAAINVDDKFEFPKGYHDPNCFFWYDCPIFFRSKINGVDWVFMMLADDTEFMVCSNFEPETDKLGVTKSGIVKGYQKSSDTFKINVSPDDYPFLVTNVQRLSGADAVKEMYDDPL